MLSFLLPAALAFLPATQSKSVEVCTANQCLQGTTNITNFGATLSTSDTDFVLLPGTYTPSVSDLNLQKAFTSSSSTVSIGNGFTNSTAASAPATPSLPLSLVLQPGVLSYPTDGFVGQPKFISQPTSPNSFNGTALGLGSFLIAPNTWAVIEATTGSSTSRVVIWDNYPFWSQLPPALAISSSVSIKDIQSSTCSPACSSKAICSTQGKCVCPTGFTGSSCELCQPGFFGPNCSKCPSNCDKCDEGPSGTGACLSTPLPSTSPSKCNCSNGSCGSSGTCTCVTGWANASNGTACATCDTGFFLDPSSGNCLSCGAACTSCSATACTTCAKGTIQDKNNLTQCIKDTTCAVGKFQSGTTCASCNSACGECSGPNPTDCTKCPTGTFLRGGQCLSADNTGTCQGTSLVANIGKGVCDTCPSRCAKCSIPNFDVNASTSPQPQCNECLPGLFLDGGNCVATCPAGKVVSSDGKSCTACTNGCATCAGSPSFCLTCSSGQSAFNGQCVASCPTNSFSNSSNGTCISCHPDCATCSGSGFNQCKSCPPNLPVLTSAGRCIATCSKSEYFDGSSGTCKPCDSSCGSCSTGGSAGCLTCTSDKAVLRAGKCATVDCGSGTGTVSGLGVCLAELVVVPNKDSIPPVSIPPLDPNAANNALQQNGGFKPEWWQILLMVLGALFIIALCVICWRRRARKKRAKRTEEFKANLENRGLWSKLWRNPFSIFKRKKKDNRARDLEGARSSAGDWRTSASRTDEDRKTWITMKESALRRPSITGRTMSDRYTYDSRAERSEGRTQRTKDQPMYFQPRSQYGESQFGQEIEEEDYRSNGSYSYRAPSSRQDRAPGTQQSSSREQDRLYAELMHDQASRGPSPSVYSQVTGQPRRRDEPKLPKDLLTSRFSATTEGTSMAPSKHVRRPAPQAPMPESETGSLQEYEPSQYRQPSDAELYKISTLFPELKNEPRDYSSSGTTAVDKNPFRRPTY